MEGYQWAIVLKGAYGCRCMVIGRDSRPALLVGDAIPYPLADKAIRPLMGKAVVS